MTFEEKAFGGYYSCGLPYGEPGTPERLKYNERQRTLNQEWSVDLRVYLIQEGVPEQYADKVAALAYEKGHSAGYGEILCEAQSLLDIFQ